jgi:Fe2+ transport system protein FeoA
MKSLSNLDAGERGTIRAFESDDPPARLLEMGLVPGTTVELVRRAPLGDPIYLNVRGYHLSIREHEADLIHVDPA